MYNNLMQMQNHYLYIDNNDNFNK